MFLEDVVRTGYRAYREHNKAIVPGIKQGKRGVQIKEQLEDGQYVEENLGDEAGWSYWGAKRGVDPGNNKIVNQENLPPGVSPSPAGNQGTNVLAGILKSFGIDTAAAPGDMKVGEVSGYTYSKSMLWDIDYAYPGDPGTINISTGLPMTMGWTFSERPTAASITRSKQKEDQKKKNIARAVKPAKFNAPLQGGQQKRASVPIAVAVASSAINIASVSSAQAPREIGSWFQNTLAVQTEEGYYPISEQGVDKSYIPKQAEYSNMDKSYVRPAPGYESPKGFPGTIVQAINQNAHEEMFVPSGNMLAVDHKVGGLSTRVFDVREDGYIDAIDGQAAALDSIVKVAKNEMEQKTVALNGTKSGKDTTGYGPIILKEQIVTAQSNEYLPVVSSSDKEMLAYLSSERGGPLCPGSVNDLHKIGENKDGLVVTPAHIITNANFFMNSSKDGPLAFSSEAYPYLEIQASEEKDKKAVKSEVKCAWDGVTRQWRWYNQGGAGAKEYAVIRWDYTDDDISSDMSEGQLYDYDLENDKWEETPSLVWIDTQASGEINFQTAGATKFWVENIGDATRNGTERPLYRAVQVVSDHEAFRVTHMIILAKSPFLAGYLASNEDAVVWDTYEADGLAADCLIKTKIGDQTKPNKLIAIVSDEWDISNAADNYKYLERNGCAPGVPLFMSPISPAKKNSDATDKRYDSATLYSGSTIASYRRL